ncbi:hypothetical protein JDV02_008208 [Purpureocillium takamizusanense]|uniref:BZIP domain-containing protein n=1 Tax=Purpureocillium takamizusanense TaxID=2060973 RepID=A0A9Q8VEV9_9HYPO|nr:uncharacterized protein JDV02_008208 [Purpureocillium takamizusanense]UNI22309.1 hypothetical protein JDV02_008208 [Purpureocillium takamizusanense]
MNSSLLVLHNPYDPRDLDGGKSLATTNQLGGQWGDAYPLDQGLMMKEQESFPPSGNIFGEDAFSQMCIDGPMAGLDANGFSAAGVNGRSNTIQCMQLGNASYAPTTDTSLSNESPGSINSSPPEMTIHTASSSESPSPRTKPSTVKKRGRPRKAQLAVSAATVSKDDAGSITKSKPRTSIKSEADASGAEDPRALRVREKNRIAADKCRSRRRQEEDKLKSKHEDLEQEHRRLSGALSELMAETYVLKNMLMEHGNCDCRLIQDYLKESASEWVAKKLKASASPAGPSPS